MIRIFDHEDEAITSFRAGLEKAFRTLESAVLGETQDGKWDDDVAIQFYRANASDTEKDAKMLLYFFAYHWGIEEGYKRELLD